MKRKRIIEIVVTILLIVLFAASRDGSFQVRYSGRWFGFSELIYYGQDAAVVGRNFTIGPIAIDHFYPTETIMTNETAAKSVRESKQLGEGR